MLVLFARSWSDKIQEMNWRNAFSYLFIEAKKEEDSLANTLDRLAELEERPLPPAPYADLDFENQPQVLSKVHMKG